jgi:sarcosine oxidase subunit delta
MIVITCPCCGEERHEAELRFGGEAGIQRAPDPAAQDDRGWTDYLYMRTNPKGVHLEQWCCAAGCGQWFKVARDTVSHAVLEVVRYDQPFIIAIADTQ